MTFSKIALAAAFSLATAGAAFADQPGADWIGMDQASQKLKEAGYSHIAEMEADDGFWEGEGTKNGQRFEFRLDPKTGAVVSEHPDND